MKVWARLGFVLLTLCCACSGGGGPGAAMDSGGPGGPVGAGNYAAGPVSLPAPTSTANLPTQWAYIKCTNVVGPNFECKGSPLSLPANSQLQLTVFAPASATPKGSVTATAAADGTFSASEAGNEGDSVELCPLVKGLCQGARFIKLPPEGVTVDGAQGTMKNLVILGGDSFHSAYVPKKKPSWDWTSLFLGTARAEEPADTAPKAPPVVAQCGSIIALPAYEIIDPAAPKCYLFSTPAGQPEQVAATFDNCIQSDIKSVVGSEDPETHQPQLFVAIKTKVYVLQTQPQPKIIREIWFPSTVNDLVDHGNHVTVFLQPVATKVSDGTDQSFYFIDKLPAQGFQSLCYEPYAAMQSLQEVTSSDSLGVGFAMTGYYQNADYRILVGNFYNGSKLRSGPTSIFQSTNPLEVKVLKAGDTDIAVAVLNAAEKQLSLIQLTFGGSPTVIQVPLEGLRIGATTLTVNAPQLLSVNREAGELAFISIERGGTKLVTMKYLDDHGVVVRPSSASVTNLASEAPTVLARDNSDASTGWAYNGNDGQLHRVRPSYETMQLDSATIIPDAATGAQLAPTIHLIVPTTTDDD